MVRAATGTELQNAGQFFALRIASVNAGRLRQQVYTDVPVKRMRRNKTWPAVWLGLLLPAAIWAGGPGGSGIAPGLVLARYLAAGSQAPAWDTATIDIEASIPRLAKRGHLRAIRRLLPFGGPDYQVLGTEGDRTVRQQVIARYLSAEVEAAALPPASVAITPANYRFQYRGSTADGGTLAYIFEITPRKKRAGLIRGQLWIDAGSGLVLRQAGYLVRSPSIFVRRVNITRDTTPRDGAPYERITRLEIDTRLVGRAELTVTERPYAPATGEEMAADDGTVAAIEQAVSVRQGITVPVRQDRSLTVAALNPAPSRDRKGNVA